MELAMILIVQLPFKINRHKSKLIVNHFQLQIIRIFNNQFKDLKQIIPSEIRNKT